MHVDEPRAVADLVGVGNHPRALHHLALGELHLALATGGDGLVGKEFRLGIQLGLAVHEALVRGVEVLVHRAHPDHLVLLLKGAAAEHRGIVKVDPRRGNGVDQARSKARRQQASSSSSSLHACCRWLGEEFS